MIILGIDPGSRITGYGIINTSKNHLDYIDSGCIKTNPQEPLDHRLLTIFEAVRHLITTYQPHEMAIESVFMHQNPSAALKLGHARGAIVVAGALNKIPIFNYSPREVKQSVVGYGAAEKNQVREMVMQLLRLPKPPQQDASDALAIAISHHHAKHSILHQLHKEFSS